MVDKIIIKVATSNTRGFLRNLLDYNYENIEFIYNKNAVYEISSKTRNFLATIIKWPIFDYFGVFQVVESKGFDCDMYFSYNRFLNADKPYVILLENPSALVNYCWERPDYIITKKRLTKLFAAPELKGIICMSKVCYSHLRDLYDIPNSLQVWQVYPFVLDDDDYSDLQIQKKAHSRVMECLYVSSEFNLKGGCDIIEVCRYFEKNNPSIHVTCITRQDSIHEKQNEIIKNLSNLDIVEFNLSKSELDEYYKKASVLLNPTRLDSFSLVTLEAMKYGCTLIATDVYAIKEMVDDGINGFLGNSMYTAWDEDGKLNKYIRKHMKETVCSGEIDENIVRWMIDKLEMLNANRDLLEQMCVSSFARSRNHEFSEKAISEEWSKILIGALEG